jgi:3-oxoacyl-[acyl-carrier protein] reductase
MLKGMHIVVTEASRGIGRAIARACAREGAVVGVNYCRSEAAARALVAEDSEHFRPLAFDVTDPEGVREAVSRFVQREGKIDGWVNNAGVFSAGLVLKADVAEWRRQVEVNLLGPLICARAVLPVMVKRRQGVMLNVSSVAAERPVPGQAAYAATKGGVEALTRALAVEYSRKGIRVVTLRPGPVRTDMLDQVLAAAGEEALGGTLVDRPGQPEEVAGLAVFLLSAQAQFATGSTFTFDGGYLQGGNPRPAEGRPQPRPLPPSLPLATQESRTAL